MAYVLSQRVKGLGAMATENKYPPRKHSIGRRLCSRLASFVSTLGILAFLSGFACSVLGPLYPLVGRSLCFPLSSPHCATIDEHGRVYVALGFYSRIQVYDSNGKFLFGFFTETGGGSFRMHFAPDGYLRVATARGRQLHIYDEAGHLMSSQERVKGAYEQALTVNHYGGSFVLSNPLLNPEIAYLDASGKVATRIRTPTLFWPLLGPLPCIFTVLALHWLRRLVEYSMNRLDGEDNCRDKF